MGGMAKRTARRTIDEGSYQPNNQRAKTDDPTTWATRAEVAEAVPKIVNGLDGGVGIVLGDIGGDLHLCGLDLDTCLRDSTIAPWAAAILDVAETYAEISPSGAGLKAFFYVVSGKIRPFLDRIGVERKAWGCRRDVPGEDARNHGPAIEVYASWRFFTVTDRKWPHAPDRLRVLDDAELERLARLIPPAKSADFDRAGRGDNSRSAAAFRKGVAIRRAGKTFAEMWEALRSDPETGSWVKEKGDQRQLSRIWDKAASDNDALPTITVRAGLRHEAADAGLAALEAPEPLFISAASRLSASLPSPQKQRTAPKRRPRHRPGKSCRTGPRTRPLRALGRVRPQRRAGSNRSAASRRRTDCRHGWRMAVPDTGRRDRHAHDARRRLAPSR